MQTRYEKTLRIFTAVLLAFAGFSVIGQESSAAEPNENGWMTFSGGHGPVPQIPGTHPIFGDWAFSQRAPVRCEFAVRPTTGYQVFVGLTEAHWDEPGRRIIDLEINGSRVATLDTFHEKKNTPHGHLFPARSDASGRIHILLRPNPKAEDKNPAVCGFLLFPGNVELDPDAIVHGRGPKALVVVNPLLLPKELTEADMKGRGKYFVKKKYEPEPVPRFESMRKKLPVPIFDENPRSVACYYKAWELAFDHFRTPIPGSPFVSNYIDEAFNPSLFLWDTAFMTMFCNMAYPLVPGIQSLDNFYATQLPDGEIVREVSEKTGEPHPASRPGTPDSLNHPILAWAEREAYRISGDRRRLEQVYPPLVQYLRSYERIREPRSGFYLGTWASMDNSPRIPGMLCSIDTTSEVVLFARDLAFFARELGKKEDAAKFLAFARNLSDRINEKLWDEATGFYYDWAATHQRHDVRTIAGYWTLLAGVTTAPRAERLVKNLFDSQQFGRLHLVPTTPADTPGYDPKGGYWRGSVWSPTTHMVVRGLERSGHPKRAREVALNHLRNVVAVYEKTGTLWENYAPDAVAPGQPAKPDFVGWTGLAPILLLIEYAIGIQADAPANQITWTMTSPERVGIRNFWFGGKTVSLLAEKPDPTGRRMVKVQSTGTFTLKIRSGDATGVFPVEEGEQAFSWLP